MATGLLWRVHLFPITGSVAKYGGDAWWALLVFIGCGFLFNAASTRRVVTLSLCFAWLIEFSQLCRAPWIDSIRSTRAGHIVLGSTFNTPDLLAYAAGIALGAWAEHTCPHLIRRVSSASHLHPDNRPHCNAEN